jgi:hypothetical protein
MWLKNEESGIKQQYQLFVGRKNSIVGILNLHPFLVYIIIADATALNIIYNAPLLRGDNSSGWQPPLPSIKY